MAHESDFNPTHAIQMMRLVAWKENVLASCERFYLSLRSIFPTPFFIERPHRQENLVFRQYVQGSCRLYGCVRFSLEAAEEKPSVSSLWECCRPNLASQLTLSYFWELISLLRDTLTATTAPSTPPTIPTRCGSMSVSASGIFSYSQCGSFICSALDGLSFHALLGDGGGVETSRKSNRAFVRNSSCLSHSASPACAGSRTSPARDSRCLPIWSPCTRNSKREDTTRNGMNLSCCALSRNAFHIWSRARK